MYLKRNIIIVFALLAVVAVIAPCGGRGDSKTAQASKTIGLSLNALDEFTV